MDESLELVRRNNGSLCFGISLATPATLRCELDCPRIAGKTEPGSKLTASASAATAVASDRMSSLQPLEAGHHLMFP
jgi:hypothetical protein